MHLSQMTPQDCPPLSPQGPSGSGKRSSKGRPLATALSSAASPSAAWYSSTADTRLPCSAARSTSPNRAKSSTSGGPWRAAGMPATKRARSLGKPSAGEACCLMYR